MVRPSPTFANIFRHIGPLCLPAKLGLCSWLLMFCLLVPFEDIAWLSFWPAFALQALISLVLLRLHPRPVAFTPSYEFTVSFMGVAFGMCSAVCRVHTHFLTPPIQLAAIWSHGPLWVARRVVTGAHVNQLAIRHGANSPSCTAGFLQLPRASCPAGPLRLRTGFPLPASGHHSRLPAKPLHVPAALCAAPGFVLVLASKELSRKVLLVLLPELYRFFPFRLRRLWQPPVHSLCQPKDIADPEMRELPHDAKAKPWDVVSTSRFFAYAAIGWAVAELSPRCFDLLGW